jgi:hypothetical protein
MLRIKPANEQLEAGSSHAVFRIKKCFVPEDCFNPSQYFIAAALGDRAPVAGAAGFTRKLPRHLLHTDQ